MYGTRKDREDTTLVQIEEEVTCVIRSLSFVTKLSPVGVRNSHGHGYRVSLRCPSEACEEYGSCGKKQEPPVQVSSRHPTLHACFQDLLKRLQEKHGKYAELFHQVKKRAQAVHDRTTTSQDQAKSAKKVALEEEKDVGF
jgi:hypothetical protein